MAALNIDDLVGKYLKLRELKKEKEEAHKREVAPISEMMGKLEMLFLQRMNEAGLESLPTKHGTPYKSKRTSATVADWEAVYSFIREHELDNMLERRVNKSAVQQYVEEHGDLPPGVNWREEIVVNVRGANG